MLRYCDYFRAARHAILLLRYMMAHYAMPLPYLIRCHAAAMPFCRYDTLILPRYFDAAAMLPLRHAAAALALRRFSAAMPPLHVHYAAAA